MKSRFAHATVLFSVLFSVSLATQAAVLPQHDPDNAEGAKEFNWQAEWGTIHMNSFADGINDPGTFASDHGSVGCPQGSVCKDPVVIDKVPGLAVPSETQIKNGIKFDIKNSLLNCMARPVTNWAINNSWQPEHGTYGVCIPKYDLHGPAGRPTSGPTAKLPVDAPTVIYMPVWDKRGNDERFQTSGTAGCQQQVINNCASDPDGKNIIRDIHSCVRQDVNDATPPYTFPVTHVFSPEHVADLGGRGTQLPTTYYSYEKDLGGGKTRIALATEDPTGYADRVNGTSVRTIKAETNEDLARLKTYRFKSDETDFVVVDPSDFFDLRLYLKNGKYDAAYPKVNKTTKLVETYDSCPVLGLNGGYSGICDPTGQAGCNLPIYEAGPTTTFTDVSGKEFSYSNYPIRWSGYVKKWAVISRAQFLDNIRGREELYIDSHWVEEAPILMLTRADNYCDPLERVSNPQLACQKNTTVKPDMPCIQYLQWMAADEAKTEYVFLDLFNPTEYNCSIRDPEYNSMRLYDLDEDGRPIADSPVAGTGSNVYVGDGKTSTGFVSLLDDGVSLKADGSGPRPLAMYKKKVRGESVPETYPAVFKADPVESTAGRPVPGQYLMKTASGAPDPSKGTGIPVMPGSAVVMRPTEKLAVGDRSHSCVLVTYKPDAQQNLFIPTNSQKEMQAFVSAMVSDPVEYASLRPCSGNYQPNREVAGAVAGGNIPKARPAAGPINTWVGKLSCDELTDKPACNETKRVSAQRYCRLENGSLDQCSACAESADQDESFNKNWFADGKVEDNVRSNELMSNPLHEGKGCFFAASCFNTAADGCPSATVSGGHVFCLSPDTKIRMADGKEKEIKKIKAGDEVLTFHAKATRSGALGAGKVKAVAVTKKQKVLKINDLRITPLHKVVLSSGRSVPAKDIKVGDHILNADGTIQEVKRIDVNQPKITVYNLVLENGSDGYIAGGVRVMSYPMLKGLNDGESDLTKTARALQSSDGRGIASVKAETGRKQQAAPKALRWPARQQ